MKLPEFLRPRRFGLKVFIFVLPILVTFSVLSTVIGSRERRKQVFEAAEDKTHGIAHMTSFGLGPALFFEDARTIDEVVQSARQNSDLAYLVVLDESGRVVAEFNRTAAPPSNAAPLARGTHMGHLSPNGEMYHFEIPVAYGERQLGRLLLGLSLREALHEAADSQRKLIVIRLGLLVSGLIAVLFLSMTITKPLRRLAETAREIAHGDMTKRARVSSLDESGQMAMAFNTMVDALAESRAGLEDRVERRTRELREANDKLHGTVLALEQRNAQALLFSELYEAFQACRKAEEIYETAGRFAGKLFPGDAGIIYIFKESRNLLDAVAAWGPGEPAGGVLVPDDCWALRRGKAHLADNSTTVPICPHVLSDKSVPPYACVPLAARGETLGLFHLRFGGGSVARDRRTGGAGLGLAQNFAERVSLALDNFRLWQKLLQQSIRDPLTGLFNRRYMEETLGRELARAERNKTPLGVIMMDIDKFKDFNDSFGHDAGDEMLKAIGAFLPANVRREDVVCRYGGEEFLIILPGASLEASAERARKLCAGVRPLRVESNRIALGPISFSLGVAAFPKHGSIGRAIVQAADMALLKAKKDGRDRVVVAE